MKKRLFTLDYEEYQISKDFLERPICLGTKLKNIEKSIKQYNINTAFSSLKDLGKKLHEFNDETIELSKDIDELIMKDINNSTSDLLIKNYYYNFDDVLYTNISNYNCMELVSWLQEYGVQNIPSYIYEDIKQFEYINVSDEANVTDYIYLTKIKDKYIFELLPIINISLSIYFTSRITDSLDLLINAKNKSYLYQKLREVLGPFPMLFEYYIEHCFHKEKCFNDKEGDYDRYVFKLDDKFMNIVTNYILKLYVILTKYLDNINLPISEDYITHTYPKSPEKLLQYKDIKYADTRKIHHNVLRPCCYKLFEDVMSFLPKCIKCSKPIKYNKYLCPEHLIEFGELKLKKYKGNDKSILEKIHNELDNLKQDETSPTPTIDKLYSKKLKDDKYDAKRKVGN